ncbi:MAG: sodium:proline symporter [Pseudomonadota bacterium]|nr:sodium:proline symporter [Pseudomonadota bacterium]
MNWSAAVYAGAIAGILAAVVQIALWSVFTDALSTTLFRDARFAAAIVMGQGVLAPPASFSWQTMLVATLVHFALSIAYGLALSPLTARLRILPALFAGAAFGVLLYAINMYGFTTLFPWFEAARDWITLVTHMAFGVTVAGAYKMLR